MTRGIGTAYWAVLKNSSNGCCQSVGVPFAWQEQNEVAASR